MEDATLCETADAAPASLIGAASESGTKIDQSLTCQGTEKRTRDEGAKLAPTFAQIKRARRAQSRAGAWAVPWPRPVRGLAGSHTEPTPSRSCVHRTHSLASADRIPYVHASTIPGAAASWSPRWTASSSTSPSTPPRVCS